MLLGSSINVKLPGTNLFVLIFCISVVVFPALSVAIIVIVYSVSSSNCVNFPVVFVAITVSPFFISYVTVCNPLSSSTAFACTVILFVVFVFVEFTVGAVLSTYTYTVSVVSFVPSDVIVVISYNPVSVVIVFWNPPSAVSVEFSFVIVSVAPF